MGRRMRPQLYLGGRCPWGRSNFTLEDDEYRNALKRLVSASETTNVVIFCAEGEPESCHRSYEVGVALLFLEGIQSFSIRRDGGQEDLSATLRRVPRSRARLEFRDALDGASADINWQAETNLRR